MAKRNSYFKGKTQSAFELTKRERRELESYRLKRDLGPFVEEFKLALITMASHNPYDSWPAWYKQAFIFTQRSYPIPAQLYLDNLPKR